MAELSDLFDSLYTHFVLRDILCKAVPGFLLVLLIVYPLLGVGAPSLVISDLPALVAIPVVYGLSFMLGMSLQFVGARLGLTKIHVWDRQAERTAEQQSLAMAKHFIQQNNGLSHALRARERFVILKEMATSYATLSALSVLVVPFVGLQVAGAFTPITVVSSLGLAVLALVLRAQNHMHAREQKYWESVEEAPPQAAPRAGRSARANSSPKTRTARPSK